MKNAFTKKSDKPNFRWKGLVSLLFFLGGFVSQVCGADRFYFESWYNLKSAKVVSQDPCGRLYKVILTKEDKNVLIFAIGENGKLLKNTDFTYTNLSPDGTNGFRDNNGSTETLEFFINTTTSKYEITFSDNVTLNTAACSIEKDVETSYDLGQTVKYSATFCPRTGGNSSATYQWQNSIDGKTWSDISGATGSTLDYTAVFDYRFVRCVATYNDSGEKTVASEPDEILINEPKFDIEFSSNVVKLNSYEYEVERWEDYQILVKDINVSDYSLLLEAQKPDSHTSTQVTNVKELPNNAGWSIVSVENTEYVVSVVVKLLHYGGQDKEAKLSKTVLVRSVYTADKDAESKTLFFDDFGYIDTDNKKYYYNDAQGNATSVEVNNPTSGVYWAEDKNGFVVGHKYAMLDDRNDETTIPTYRDNDGNIHLDCAVDNYTHFACWEGCNGYRVEDGYYAIVTNPSKSDCGNNDYWSGEDHTGSTEGVGAMLFVNCLEDSKDKVIYERPFTLPADCKDNAYVLFSAYVSNAVKKKYAVNGDLSTPVNVRFDILSEDGNTLLGSCSSGDVVTRDYLNPNWAHMTTAFQLSGGNTYLVRITNNMSGGAGNDVLLDDISVTLCFPNIELKTDADGGEIKDDVVYICGVDRALNIKAENKNDIKNYIPNPVYCFQYSSDEGNTWEYLVDGKYQATNNVDVEFSRDRKLFMGTTQFRVIVANSESVIDDVITADASGSALPTLGCQTIYAIDNTLKVIFRPMGKDIKDTWGCIDETITIEALDSKRAVAYWLDHDGNKLVEGDSIVSIAENVLKFKIPATIGSTDKNGVWTATDTIYYLGEEVTGCVDTQIVVVHKYDDVVFTCTNEPSYCEFGAVLTPSSEVEGITYDFHIDGMDASNDQSGASFEIKKLSPELSRYTVNVVGNAPKRCPATGKFEFNVYKKFKLALKVNGDSKRSDVCLSDDDTPSTVVLTAEKNFEGATPTHGNNPSKYYWFKINGENKELIATTDEPKYEYQVKEAGILNYFVTASDDVCYTVEEAQAGTTIDNKSQDVVSQTRKHLKFDFKADKEDLCKEESVKFDVEVLNNLTSKADVFWSEDGVDVTKTTNKVDTYTHTPANDTKKMLTRTMTVTTTDTVCGMVEVSASKSYNIYYPIKIKLNTDATPYGSEEFKKCLNKAANDVKIGLSVEVIEGNPNGFVWSDNKETNKAIRDLEIVPSTNKIRVEAYDGVCRKNGAEGDVFANAGDSLVIIGSEPVSLELSVDPVEPCDGEVVTFSMKVINTINRQVEVRWAEDGVALTPESTNGAELTRDYLVRNNGNKKQKKTMVVKTLDDICANGDVEASASYDVHVPLKIHLESSAVPYKERLQKCITSDNEDNFVTVNVVVDQGDPKSFVWSDGQYPGLVAERQFIVKPGENGLNVTAFDEACNKSSATVSVNDPSKDTITVIAQRPITLDLAINKNVFCEGESAELKMNVANSLDNELQSIWSEDNAQVYTNNGVSIVQNHVVSNSTKTMVSKIMEAKVLDEICKSPADYVTDTVHYDIYKKIKFDLTSNVATASGDQICMDPNKSENPVQFTVTVTQGNPTMYVWSDSDGVIESFANQTVVSYPVKVGSNKIDVVAYDEVCSKTDGSEGFDGEKENINVEAREPIQISLDLDEGRKVMCQGEEVSLKVTINNSMPGATTKVTGLAPILPNGEYANGTYKTKKFSPSVGDSTLRVFAAEVATNICAETNDWYTVSAQTNTTIKVESSNYAVCQDLRSEESEQYITLTATVLTGIPSHMIWTTEDGERVDTVPVQRRDDGVWYSSIEVKPTKDFVYWAYGYDLICPNSTPNKAPEVTVTHKLDVEISAESVEVQMGDSVRLKAKTTLPYDGKYTWLQLEPDDKKLAVTDARKYNKRLKDDGEYVFRVTVDNGNCGVRKSDKITIYVADYNIVPNVITPYNGNPKNDTFMKGYDVSIFDRYQQVIYEGTDGWNATYRGQTVTPGTYFYIIKKKDGRVLKGTVEVYK